MQESRLLDLFCELVRIESPSFHEAPMAARCADELRGLGFEVSFDDSAERVGSDTGNLVARLPGTRTGHVVFSAHMDTVQPCAGIEPVVVDGVVRSAGDTILSADDKAGVAAIFEGVRSAVESGSPRPDVTVLLTTCEEQSLLRGRCLGRGRARVAEGSAGGYPGSRARRTFPAVRARCRRAPGTIIMGAPYHWTLRARIEGRAAHAGVEPEEGVSAIQIAAAAVAAMPLGRIDECTTANVGRIEGGVAVNIVPAVVTLMGECRSLYEGRVLAQRDAMTRALEEAAARFGGQVEVAWELDYPAVVHEPGDAIAAHLEAAAATCGLESRHATSGGGADANILGTKGADAITLGIGMTNFHSVDEYIEVADLQNMARYVEAIIAEYAG